VSYLSTCGPVFNFSLIGCDTNISYVLTRAIYEDRFCEGSPPSVPGPDTCPPFPGDLEYYSPAVTSNVSLPIGVDNSRPLRVALITDNNGRDLLFDLGSLKIELKYGHA